MCAPCSETITAGGLLPQQIVTTTTGECDAALLDQWGRVQMLAANTLIGREIATGGIAIFDASVSRHHARISRTSGAWSVIDTSSSNGTRVNGRVVSEQTLAHGDCIDFGGVRFFIVFDIGPEVRAPDPSVITAVRRSDAPAASASAQPFELLGELPTKPLRIVEPTGGGGGFLELAERTAQLSAAQLELVEILSRRMRDDAQLPTSVRGFVRSSELVGALSWDTSEPDDSHVTQLVRRVRRTLARAGFGDLIESRHRLGYRLRVIPTDSLRSV